MAGIANSWIDQYTQTSAPCVGSPNTPPSTAASCVLWLIVGLVLGGLTFQKKGSQQ